MWHHGVSDNATRLLYTLQFPKSRKQSAKSHAWIATSALLTQQSQFGDARQPLWILATMYGECVVWKSFVPEQFTSQNFFPVRLTGLHPDAFKFGTPIHLPQIHQRIIFTLDAIRAANDGSLQWITTSMDRSIHLWQVSPDSNWKQLTMLASWSCLGGDVMCMDVSQRQCLAVGCADKNIRVLSLTDTGSDPENSPRLKWRGISDKVTCVKWCPAAEAPG